MRISAQIAALVATLISIAWVIYKPGLDSAAAVAAAVAALLSTFFLKKDATESKQVQHVAGNSVGVQAGRDAKVDNFKQK
ncbi:hypothetical protein [Comamonas sp.]|uniref:hypothetical protein n=1 Tax=Comamonas sp. TaxID=34028 RepID=UPI0028A07727|nr:hypothetical protein [Comamonas sp.]